MAGKFNPLDLAASMAAGLATTAVTGIAAGVSAAASASSKALSSEAQFFDETVTPERIKHLLDNMELGTGKASMAEKTEGMKYIIASMARGRDVTEFYPDVVRNVIHKDVALKKLVYSYLVSNADANPTCREMALLTINSFQRDLSDSNQLIRAMALRVLTSIRVREIVQIQLMSLKKCASDNSPYVRKTAAHACGKIFQIDTDSKGEICEVIERLLGDKNTQVLSSAVSAFAEVCPDDWSILHPHYRKLCTLLADLDDWGQITALGVLTRYARTNFTKPQVGASDTKTPKKDDGKAKKDFYEDEDEEDEEDEDEDEEETPVEDPSTLPEDHALLLRVSAALLRSRNSGVVLAIASLHHYVGTNDSATLSKLGRALVRVMRNHREIQYIVLSNLVILARENPEMLRKFLKDFFIAESEPNFVRRMKVDVLSALASAENVTSILREFTRYVKDDDKEFVRYTIQALVRVANALPDVADRCLRGLMGLVSTDSDVVVAEAVIAIRQLLQQHPQHDGIIQRLAKKIDKIAMPSARAAIVWVMGEFQSKPRVAAMAPDALRTLAKSFKSESPEVKAQIVNLAAKTALWQAESAPVQLLLRYVLEMARYDLDYDLRDRSRMLRALLLGSEGLTALAADAVEEAGAVISLTKADGEEMAAVVASAAAVGEEGAGASVEGEVGAEVGARSRAATEGVPEGGAVVLPVFPSAPLAAVPVALVDRVKAVLLAAKPPPLIQAAFESESGGGFAMGSLSFMVGHSAKGFMGTPAWASVTSSPKLREPPSEDDDVKKPSKKRDESSDDEDDDDEDDEDDDDEDDDDEDEDEEDETPGRGGVRGRQAAGRRVVKGEEDEDEDEEEEDEDEDEDDEDDEDESD